MKTKVPALKLPTREQLLSSMVNNCNREIETFKHTLEIADRDNDRLSATIKEKESKIENLQQYKHICEGMKEQVHGLQLEVATLKGYIQRINQQDNCAHPNHPRLQEVPTHNLPHFSAPNVEYRTTPDINSGCAANKSNRW
jgi:chromosome segregation ATPase